MPFYLVLNMGSHWTTQGWQILLDIGPWQYNKIYRDDTAINYCNQFKIIAILEKYDNYLRIDSKWFQYLIANFHKCQ